MTAPGAPVRDPTYMSMTSIQMLWSAVLVSDLPVTGYSLEMDDGFGGPFTVIFDGRSNTQTFSAVVSNLVPQKFYNFRAQAFDVNGPGVYSSVTSVQACISPANLSSPLISSITKTSFKVSWSAPVVFGGCPITSYVLYRDDGQGSSVNIPIDLTTFSSRPDLFTYVVTLDSSFTGDKINV